MDAVRADLLLSSVWISDLSDMDTVKIDCEYLMTANYVLYHNRMAVCRAVEVENVSDRQLEQVLVASSGEYISPFESEVIGTINPGEKVRICPFNLSIDHTKLAELTERVTTEFRLTVKSLDELSGQEMTIAEKAFPIELMPYDQWTGTRILPQTIASFITPNHPAVNNIVVSSAAILKELTGSSSFTAYQTGNPNDVRQQVAAVLAAVHNLGIVYRALPPSYESEGQRISLPEQVIASKTANCLELTLLMASVLESIGLNCLVIFQKGHAFLGVWLVDDCNSCSVSDDPAYIEKKCSNGIDEMMVLECTQAAQENASFDAAVRTAMVAMADHDAFELFVDVKRSRLERIFPLPAKIGKDGKWSFETDGIEHDSCVLDVKEHDRFDLSLISGSNKELTKYDIWERKLLDFSLRNSLLNLSVRRRAIQFISFGVDKVENILQEGNEIVIQPRPEVNIDIEPEGKLMRSVRYEELRELVTTDIEHHVLHTFLPETETKSVLKNIHRAARNSIEETGANSLFLAIGILRWYENEQSTVPRHAPLLLVPVEMVYRKTGYRIRTRDEEIMLNITLMEFMRQNFDITINGLDSLPHDESGVNVPLIFAVVRDALKEQKRWDVEEECVLGTFSFSKFLMWNDIHTHRDELGNSEIISSLVDNQLTWTPKTVTTDLKDIDMNRSPEDTALPVEVDSSQMAAVIEAESGNSFILYGPPGTGKSQTITNLIANALFHGKRVLFVAEKMAALSVVQKRLEKIGLDPFCLELHSNKSTKRHVLQQLEKARNVVHTAAPEDYSKLAEKIYAERKKLIKYMNELHTPGADGLSVYDCILKYESIDGMPLPEFKFDKAIDAFIRKEGVKGIESMLGSRLETILKIVGQPSQHALKGLDLDRVPLTDLDEMAAVMAADAKEMSETAEDYDYLRDTKELKKRILLKNHSFILEEDPEKLSQLWHRAKARFILIRFFTKRMFLDRMKIFNLNIKLEEVDPLISDLISYRKKHDRIELLNHIIEKYYGVKTKEDVAPARSFVNKAVADLMRWSENLSQARSWIHWSDYRRDLREAGMICVAEALENREVSASNIKNAFLKALFKYKTDKKIKDAYSLLFFQGRLFDQKRKTYKQLTHDFQELTQKELFARLASRIPLQGDSSGTRGEIGLLNRNISNGGRGLSLRDLFDQLPTLLPRLCPCMLMSPMSVAQYIDLKAEKFDLVVFDEASQMPTSEAIGAIARGKALIVVGDPKQMPPTTFFSSNNIEAEEAAIDDMESILEDCRTLEMPSLQLSWHYRSRHESLIAFSNNEYYDGSLITFPSVDDRSSKVHFIPVDGEYDKGGKRCNRAEAEAIVNEIARRLRSKSLRKQSIGVIAFSVMQQALIEDILQDRLDKDKTLQEASLEMYEPIFVKNLENVQGDERDVILFSIGYGPDKTGKISMNFGPLNNAGGERRLNVAVSRARMEMYIFSTLKSTDIDLRRSKAKGVEGLKHFLEYAETRSLPTASTSRAIHHHSKIADQIARALQERGYMVATDVGRSQFRVDVAVAKDNDPNTYLLGILLDGEGYRDTPTTRDREVVQISALKSLGWNVMRVWCIDWYHNKENVIDHIIENIDSAKTKNAASARSQELSEAYEHAEEEDKSSEREYLFYSPEADSLTEMDDAMLVRNILSREQPIMFSWLCRRVVTLRGQARLTPTIQRELESLTKNFHTDRDGAIWLNKTAEKNYSYYRKASGREITEIPEKEMVNAIAESLREERTLPMHDLILHSLKKLGFNRHGTVVDATLEKVIKNMQDEGRLKISGEEVRLINR